MNQTDYQDYFLNPGEPAHRRYAAIRSVVVEEQPMKEVAQHFDISYGTVRNWVSEFCQTRDAGESPPFSRRRRADGPSPIPPTTILKFPPPMCGNSRWKPDGGGLYIDLRRTAGQPPSESNFFGDILPEMHHEDDSPVVFWVSPRFFA